MRFVNSGFDAHIGQHLSEDELYESVCLRENEMSTALVKVPFTWPLDKGPRFKEDGNLSEGIDFDAPDGEPVSDSTHCDTE